MGTNYYWRAENAKCPHCGHTNPDKVRHIGKSSAGWCFSLHVDENIKSLDDWCSIFETGHIEDEYGERLTATDMLQVITDRSFQTPFKQRGESSPYRNADEFHPRNNSERGPNHLLRHKIGPHCIGHGPGTWDLITNDFS